MADWTPEENEAIVADYFVMWEKDLRGQPYNKAEHNRYLLKKIDPDRNRSAVEQKHRNISAVLWHLGYPYLRGYKPLPNYQTSLRAIIEQRLDNEPIFGRILSKAIHAPVKSKPVIRDIASLRVPSPKRKEIEDLIKEESKKRTSFRPRNYLELESQNSQLGKSGEEFILRYEQERLFEAGKPSLAKEVVHVSQTEGDHLGYDIRSYEVDGKERLIEVKTTRYGYLTRFFASANEVDASEKLKTVYRLYRLFNFEKEPQFFILAGSLRETCKLKPVNYSALPN